MNTHTNTPKSNLRKRIRQSLCCLALPLVATPVYAEDKADATLDLRMRYENVDQDNALSTADALTLRTTLNIKSSSYKGFSVVAELEDVHTLGSLDNYNDTNGLNTGHSVIADPETTELDQAYIQYKTDKLTAKVGRQVINYDGQRFVGAVAWRQDKQTFDAVSLRYQFNKELTLNYAYVDKRNRIFGNAKDLDSSDHFFNGQYKSSIGTITAYGYLLEVDNGTDNGLDTFGVSFKGSTKNEGYTVLYAAELATQSSETATSDFDATYLMLEAGASFSGITAKVGFEQLGSDDGAYGFSTPLATLHKFNGWSDQFLGTPAQGLNDFYVSLSGSLLDGKWTAIYHDFSADESTADIDDLGSEINLLYTRKFAKKYAFGIKYAAYSDGDSAAGKVDTDKLWVWLGTKF